MQNVVVNMCEKFSNDWLRNDRALGNQKSDNNNTKNNNMNNVGGTWRPVSGSNKLYILQKNMQHVFFCNVTFILKVSIICVCLFLFFIICLIGFERCTFQ